MENNQYRLIWVHKGLWVLTCVNIYAIANNLYTKFEPYMDDAPPFYYFGELILIAVLIIASFVIFAMVCDSYVCKRTLNFKAAFTQDGGVNTAIMSSVILLMLLLMPWCGYAVRAKVSEGIIISNGLKAGVSEAFIDKGTDGIRRYAALIAADLSNMVTKKVTNVVISTAPATMGFITIKMGGIRKLNDDNTLVYSPHIDGKVLNNANRTGTVQWVCAGKTGVKALSILPVAGKGTITDQYLPGECR